MRGGGRIAAVVLSAASAGACANSVELFALTDAGAVAGDAGDAGDAAPATGSARILAAFEHTCVMDESGLFCWGRNGDGQLGLGEAGPSVERPRRVDGADEFSEICTAERHTCGLRPDGVLECWGGNTQGQLGLGDFMPRAAPTALAGAPKFLSVACGGNISCAVAEQGALYCWGENAEGELGQGESGVGRPSALPVRVPLDAPARQVSVGQGHVCAIVEGGALYCWGRNSNWQLGVMPPIEQIRTPVLVTGGGAYRQVAAGQQHTCAVERDGRLFCWGFDLDGRLGLGGNVGEVLVPTQVGEADDYLEVHVNWFHSCALGADGRLVCWGRNDEGQLGLGDWAPRFAPESVGGGAWSALTVGRFHTCGLRNGVVYCWGKNDDQQLGLGDHEVRTRPTWVPIP